MIKRSDRKEFDINVWCNEYFDAMHNKKDCFQFISFNEYSFIKELLHYEERNEALNNVGFLVLSDEFGYRMIEKRLQMYSYKLTHNAIVVLFVLFSETPGHISMLMTILEYYARRNNVKEFDVKSLMNVLSKHDNQNNVYLKPKTTFLDNIWDEQKVINDKSLGSDNAIDNYEILSNIK